MRNIPTSRRYHYNRNLFTVHRHGYADIAPNFRHVIFLQSNALAAFASYGIQEKKEQRNPAAPLHCENVCWRLTVVKRNCFSPLVHRPAPLFRFAFENFASTMRQAKHQSALW